MNNRGFFKTTLRENGLRGYRVIRRDNSAVQNNLLPLMIKGNR